MSSKNITIAENKFRESISRKFISLINSKRGIQSTLAESVGKKPSFIAEIKRGKPVNALHLKAIEIVFGPSKVLELLAIDDKQPNHENCFDLLPQSNLLMVFKQQEIALEIISNALRLEQIKPDVLKDINEYIKFRLQNALCESEKKPAKDEHKE